jgi:hypothetical protein
VFKLAVIIAAACLHSVSAEQICIQVTDPSGASVQGVSLSLGRQDAPPLTAVTNNAGNHCFSGLANGTYKLTTAHPDFHPTERIVDTAKTTEVVLALRLKDVRTELTVTGETSTPEPAGQIVLDSDAIGRLPVLGRDVIALATEWLDPGAAASGAATVIVDGMEVPATSVKPSLIDQVRISQNPYSSEFARPGRGRIEIVTKTGTKEFHGSFLSLFRHSALDARHPFAIQKPDERRRTFEASLTGPLGRSGRDSFVLSFSRENEAVQTVVLARTLEGELRANVPAPATDSEWSAGWNRHFQNASTLSLRYEFDSEAEKNRGTGGFRLPGAGFDTFQTEHQVRAAWRGLLGKVFAETGIRLERSKESAVSSASASHRLIVEDAFTAGSAQADQREEQTSLRLNQIFSWSHGSHVIRAGYQFPNAARFRVLDRRDTLGTFRFSSLDTFAAGKPYSWSAQSPSPAIAFWRIQQSAFIQDDWQVRPNLRIGLGLRWAWQSALSSRSDLAPRFSLARAFGPKRSTVLRAGIGMFHDTIDSSVIAQSILLDGSRSRRLLILNPGYPEPFNGDVEQNQVPANLYRFAPALRSPYLIQASLGLDRKWGQNVSSSIQYVASRGVSLFRSRDWNAPFDAGSPRPDSNWGVIQAIESEGRMSGNAIDVNLRGRLPRKVTLAAQYRLAAYKNDTGGTNWFPANPYAPGLDWGRADSDVRHNFTLMADWQLWRAIGIGCIFRANSGSPYTVTTGSDDNGDGLARDRPPGIGRNTREGSGSASLDVRVSREFQLRQSRDTRLRGRFSLDAFNVSNSTNYTSFVGTLRSPYFGQPTSARSPRRLQASFQLSF